MKPITVNPFIKFGFLLSQIILLLITHNNLLVLIVCCYSFIYIIWNRLNLKILIKGLKFGLLLALFIFIFSMIKYDNTTLALLNALELFKVYFAMIVVSVVYKFETSNKELAYVLSIVFSPFKVIGFDQNKLYTLFLMVLNQIYRMRTQALRIHKFSTFKQQQKLSIKATIGLVVPFINNNLKQNEMLAIGLLNSGYNPNCTTIKPYFITNYKQSLVVILIAIISIELIVII